MMVVPGWSLAKGAGKVAGSCDGATAEINTPFPGGDAAVT